MRYNKTDYIKDIERSLNLVGEIIDRLRGEVEEKVELLIDPLGPTLVQNENIIFPDIREHPSNTDFKIMRCLLCNPQMEHWQEDIYVLQNSL